MANKCHVTGIHQTISDLLRDLTYNGLLPEAQQQVLIAALNEWSDVECPVESCEAAVCPYSKTADWIGYLGYTSLANLLEHYDHTNGIVPIKERCSVDPLDATWARRPGHYNP